MAIGRSDRRAESSYLRRAACNLTTYRLEKLGFPNKRELLGSSKGLPNVRFVGESCYPELAPAIDQDD
jgi:hypothetical protein